MVFLLLLQVNLLLKDGLPILGHLFKFLHKPAFLKFHEFFGPSFPLVGFNFSLCLFIRSLLEFLVDLGFLGVFNNFLELIRSLFGLLVALLLRLCLLGLSSLILLFDLNFIFRFLLVKLKELLLQLFLPFLSLLVVLRLEVHFSL